LLLQNLSSFSLFPAPLHLLKDSFDFFFNETGRFAGFDESEPTSDSGGKTRVVKLLKAKYGYKR